MCDMYCIKDMLACRMTVNPPLSHLKLNQHVSEGWLVKMVSSAKATGYIWFVSFIERSQTIYRLDTFNCNPIDSVRANPGDYTLVVNHTTFSCIML